MSIRKQPTVSQALADVADEKQMAKFLKPDSWRRGTSAAPLDPVLWTIL